nr:uncharacterized protein LOC127493665 [Oryctolagus cuniculus]
MQQSAHKCPEKHNSIPCTITRSENSASSRDRRWRRGSKSEGVVPRGAPKLPGRPALSSLGGGAGTVAAAPPGPPGYWGQRSPPNAGAQKAARRGPKRPGLEAGARRAAPWDSGAGVRQRLRPCLWKRRTPQDSSSLKQLREGSAGFRRSLLCAHPVGLSEALAFLSRALPFPALPPRPLRLRPRSLEKGEGAPCWPEAAGAATASASLRPRRGPARPHLDPPALQRPGPLKKQKTKQTHTKRHHPPSPRQLLEDQLAAFSNKGRSSTHLSCGQQFMKR